MWAPLVATAVAGSDSCVLLVSADRCSHNVWVACRNGARLHHLCRGWVTVLRGLCRALEAEEEARRFRAAPMRYGPIDRCEWAAAAAATAACVAAVLLLLLPLL